MVKSKTPVPPHLGTVTPYMIIKDADQAISFFERAFNAQKIYDMKGPDGKIMHAEVKLGTSTVFVTEETPEMCAFAASEKGSTGCFLMLYVENVDALVEQAIKAGCTVKQPLADMFWGDRYGSLVDPYGNIWAVATHIEDVAPDEMMKRQAEMFKKQTASVAGI